MLSQKRIFSSMNPIGIDRGRKKKTKLGSAEEAKRKKKAEEKNEGRVARITRKILWHRM